MTVCFVCINWALVLIACHYTKSANDLLIWISFINTFVNGGVLEPYWWGSWGTEDKMVGKHSSRLRICLEVIALKRKTFCYNQVMSRSEMQLNAGKTDWSHRDRPQSLTTFCWTDLIRYDEVLLVSVGQILLGMRGLLLWSGSPCGEGEEQKATRPPLLQDAAPTSGRHFLAVQRKAVVVSANQMMSGDQGWGGGGDKRWEKAWICL